MKVWEPAAKLFAIQGLDSLRSGCGDAEQLRRGGLVALGSSKQLDHSAFDLFEHFVQFRLFRSFRPRPRLSINISSANRQRKMLD